MKREKKRILAISLLMLSVFAVQMYQPVLAMEFEENIIPLVNRWEIADEAAGDDTTEGLVKGPDLLLMGQKGVDHYVITNDADSADRYTMENFADLDAKIRELGALGNAYTLTLNQELVVTGDNSLTFPGPSTWTVEGNDNTVKKEEGAPVNLNRVIMIGEAGSLSTVRLKNVVIDGANTYRACVIAEGSTLIMDSGAIIQNGYSASGATTGGIHMWRDTNLYMKPGSKISGNVSETNSYYGGAIRMLRNCVVDIDGAVISGNRVSNSGGAIHAPHSATSVSIKNTTFSENVAYSNAYQGFGGVIHSAALTIIDNCIFENNIAKTGGGAIYMALVGASDSDNEELIVKNTTFTGNKALLGGAIASNLKTSIEGGAFEGNIATNYGGAITLTARSTASLTIETTAFTKNKSPRGGAIFTQQETTIKNGTSFVGNEASVEGGAIYVHPSSYLDPADSSKYANLTTDNTTVFQNNKASFPYQPPSNYASFSNLLFSSTTFTNQVNPYSGEAVLWNDSLLNNYDINYKNSSDNTLCSISYSFVDADAGSLPQEVQDLLPETGEAGIGSIVIPEAPASNAVELANNGGKWVFIGWNIEQVNIPQEGVAFIGTWRFIPAVIYPVTYSVIYAGGADAMGVPVDNNQYISGATVTILGAPTREGYRFLGWRMNSLLLQPGDVITVANADIVLTAEWEKVEAGTTPGGETNADDDPKPDNSGRDNTGGNAGNTGNIGADAEENEPPEPMVPPTINAVNEGDRTISGTAEPGATVTVILPDGTRITTTADDNGFWSVHIPDGVQLIGGETITVTVYVPGKGESEPISATVIGASEPGSCEPEGTVSPDDAGTRDWAFANLMMTLCTMLLAVMLGLAKREKEDGTGKVRHRRYFTFGVIIAVIAAVIFLLTQDMTKPMAMTDNWTIGMAVLLVAETLMVCLGLKWRDVKSHGKADPGRK